MALKLVNEKNIPWFKLIYSVVNEELLSSTDRKIDLIAVMDMDTHGFFIVIQTCDGKCFGIHTGLNRRLTGIMN